MNKHQLNDEVQYKNDRHTVAVIGCSGFIGKVLVNELLQKNYDVIAVYNNHKSADNDMKVKYLKGINSLVDRYEKEKLDIIFDLAWSGTSGPLRGDVYTQINNINDRIKIIRFCATKKCRYVGAGSLMEKESIISTFNDYVHPLSDTIYTHAKYMAHSCTKAIANELGVDYIWGRITNAYGPNETTPRLINNTIRKVLNNEVPSFSSGSQYYDFIHVKDLAQAFIAIGEKGKTNTDYLLGSGKPRRLREYLETINKLIAPNIQFKYGEDPEPNKLLELKEYDTSKLQSDTGFKCKLSFEEGILQTYESYKKTIS